MFTSLAAAKLSDLLRPQYVGNPVNSHVIDSVQERTPDFDAMKRAIEAEPTRPDQSQSAPQREPEVIRAR